MCRSMLWICCVFALFGCDKSSPVSSPSEDTDAGVKDTVLSGLVWLDAPLDLATVEIYDYRDGQKGDRYARIEAGEDGTWAANLGILFGDFLVEATGSSSETPHPLESIVMGVELVVRPRGRVPDTSAV